MFTFQCAAGRLAIGVVHCYGKSKSKRKRCEALILWMYRKPLHRVFRTIYTHMHIYIHLEDIWRIHAVIACVCVRAQHTSFDNHLRAAERTRCAVPAVLLCTSIWAPPNTPPSPPGSCWEEHISHPSPPGVILLARHFVVVVTPGGP